MLAMRALISTLRATQASLGRPSMAHPAEGMRLIAMSSGFLRSDLAQRLLEHLRRLAALDQVAVVDDDRRHRVDARLLPHRLGGTHLVAELAAVEHLPRRVDGQADR